MRVHRLRSEDLERMTDAEYELFKRLDTVCLDRQKRPRQ